MPVFVISRPDNSDSDNYQPTRLLYDGRAGAWFDPDTGSPADPKTGRVFTPDELHPKLALGVKSPQNNRCGHHDKDTGRCLYTRLLNEENCVLHRGLAPKKLSPPPKFGAPKTGTQLKLRVNLRKS